MKLIKPYVYSNYYGTDIYRMRGNKNVYYFALTRNGRIPVHDKHRTYRKAIAQLKARRDRSEKANVKAAAILKNAPRIKAINEELNILRIKVKELVLMKKALQ